MQAVLTAFALWGLFCLSGCFLVGRVCWRFGDFIAWVVLSGLGTCPPPRLCSRLLASSATEVLAAAMYIAWSLAPGPGWFTRNFRRMGWNKLQLNLGGPKAFAERQVLQAKPLCNLLRASCWATCWREFL